MPHLGDLEASPLPQQHVARRHADVGEVDLGMAVGRVVVAKHHHGPHHLRVGGKTRH